MMALVKMKRMILWSIAQEPEKRRDPTLGPAAAGAIGQVTMMALVEINKDKLA